MEVEVANSKQSLKIDVVIELGTDEMAISPGQISRWGDELHVACSKSTGVGESNTIS